MEFFCQQIFWIFSKADSFVTTFQASLSFHIWKHTKSPLFVRTLKILREKPRLESANSSNRQIRQFRSAAVFPGNGDTKSHLYLERKSRVERIGSGSSWYCFASANNQSVNFQSVSITIRVWAYYALTPTRAQFPSRN